MIGLNFRDLDPEADGLKEASPKMLAFPRVGHATEKPVAVLSYPGGVVAALGTLTVRTSIHQASVDEKFDLVVLLMTTVHGRMRIHPSMLLIRLLLQQPEHHLAITHQQILRCESEQGR